MPVRGNSHTKQSNSRLLVLRLKMHGSVVTEVLRQTCGTDSWWHLADRRCWRPMTLETDTQ